MVPAKDVDAGRPPSAKGGSPAWLLWLVGAGLVLAGAGVALAIALPLTLRKPAASSSTDSTPFSLGSSAGATRTYYLAAEPVAWDYAPSGRNLCKDQPFTEEQAVHITDGIGRVYTKAVFKQYADGSFKAPTKRTAEQLHMGLLGPALYAEAGDTLEVTTRNMLTFPINLEPSGLMFPTPVVLNPNETFTYRWRVPESAGPRPGDASSRLWVYRSTADLIGHTNAGLAGPLVITRKGGLAASGDRPADVDRELFLDLQVFNEGSSALMPQNLAAHEKKLANMTEDEVAATQLKHAINGYVYCNIPGLNMTTGQRVRWYVLSLGNEDSIHTAHWHGISLVGAGKHMDQVVVQSSSLLVLDAYVDNPGTWLFHCHLTDHIEGGMMALFTVTGQPPVHTLNGKTRTYYIAAEEKVWDYAPFGGEMCGGTLVNFSDSAATFLAPGKDRVGRKYLKALYVEYEDEAFTRPKRRAPEWEHLGVMGPLIRGVVGDTLKVVFRNKLSDNTVSIHPHGVWYDKESEGSPYADGAPATLGDAVSPNKTVTYTWLVPERAGPGPNDFSSIMWMYHSHVNEAADPYAGLFGAIIITKQDLANEDATPRDVDREYVLTFAILDEVNSILAEANLARALPGASADLMEDPGFQEASLKHSINGYMYCNLPGLDFNQGGEARLYLMALGSSADMHTPNSVESQFYLDGQRKQSVQLLPGAMMTVDVTPMAPGKGLLQCHVYDHISAGMSALYNVKNLKAVELSPTAPRRTYYIAAEPYTWDYTPLGYDGCTGAAFTPEQQVFTETTNSTMGRVNKKARFVQYTDDTFTRRVPVPDYYGILGPMLKAEVGDVLEVHFLNRMRVASSFQVFGGLVPLANTSAYQLGLNAPSSSSAGGRRRLGRRLAQITAAQAEAEAIIAQSVENMYQLNGVAPGERTTYQWLVPDAVLGPRDPGAAVYAYVSGVDHIKHINAGLVGPLVVLPKGGLSQAGPADLEVPLLFNIQNEMQSLYLEDNIKAQEAAHPGVKVNTSALSYPESNLKHSINGFLYCNMPSLEVRAGSRVRWYIMGFGSEADMHSPVFPGQSISNAGVPVWSVGVMPAATYVVDMVASSTPGSSVFYCNILDHVVSGMQARLVVS